MAVPFGFSIGDFIAASHVVRKIWQFASNSAGLRAEFTTLSEQYHELLDLVTRIALIHQRGNVSIAPATQNSIDLHLSRCRKLLEQFDKDASPAIARSGWRQSSQHLRTVLASDSAIKELNQRFEREISAIRSYVDLVVA
jgi:mannose-1-phosphate guanylyltransferase